MRGDLGWVDLETSFAFAGTGSLYEASDLISEAVFKAGLNASPAIRSTNGPGRRANMLTNNVRGTGETPPENGYRLG